MATISHFISATKGTIAPKLKNMARFFFYYYYFYYLFHWNPGTVELSTVGTWFHGKDLIPYLFSPKELF